MIGTKNQRVETSDEKKISVDNSESFVLYWSFAVYIYPCSNQETISELEV
jgi:hypothetical protein